MVRKLNQIKLLGGPYTTALDDGREAVFTWWQLPNGSQKHTSTLEVANVNLDEVAEQHRITLQSALDARKLR